MRDAMRHFIAEFVGTFALVFVGSGSDHDGAAHERRPPLIDRHSRMG